ncbi:hypothetical protein GQ55_9G491200 [Panicum hallii var. hallii]|uniref:Uncharacterized protein n=1 Tax=Panicum hallii var. hallii TaxID=1504633 RepID=A0A2T7CD56_9POAL|nr:hypothetical protein GQ55_9G491200 [Panicum hallii var. hallii]
MMPRTDGDVAVGVPRRRTQRSNTWQAPRRNQPHHTPGRRASWTRRRKRARRDETRERGVREDRTDSRTAGPALRHD